MPFSNVQSTGGSISIKDEGITIAAAASSIDFQGSGVTGTAIGSSVTEIITSGGSGTLSYEAANETPNGVITSFTFTHNVGVIFQNGFAQFTGSIGNLSSISTNTAVFKTAPNTGDEIRNGYIA